MKQIRFGVVGTNFITDWLIAGARLDPRFRLQAVCSRTAERAAEFAARHSIPLTFTSLDQMAASPEIDAVYIASPNSMHASQSILCMSHGKHVLCEKPLASDAAEVRSMIEAAEHNNVTFMEAMKPTLSPGFNALRNAIGRIGRPRRYFAAYCQYSSRYDSFLRGELPNAFNPAYSGGALMDLGVYTIYPMVVLFGKPVSVKASSTLLSSGVDGQGTALFHYPDGFQASVIYSKITDSTLHSELQGENGTLSVDHINSIGSITFTPRRNNRGGGAANPTTPEQIPFPANVDEYGCEVSEFIDLILSGRRQSSINTHANSLTVMEIVDGIRFQTGIRYTNS